MSQSYTLYFPSPKRMLYRWMGRFLLLGSSTLFIGFSNSQPLTYGWPVSGYALLILDLFFYKKTKRSTILSDGLLIQSIAWITAGQWLVAVILLLLYIFHRQSIQPHSIRFETAGIRMNFPWPKRIEWPSIEFALLKDGILTLEYRNGKVFQQVIEKDTDLQEGNFNEFCQQQCKP